MKYIFIQIFLLTFLVLPFEAVSQDENMPTVRTLMQDCESNQATNELYCYGYVTGIMHGFGIRLVDRSENIISEPLFCPETYLNAAQATQIFINWAEKNPERWNDDMWKGVVLSLSQAYPCDED